MDRYYNSDSTKKKRSTKNQENYKLSDEKIDYNNIEQIIDIKSDQIDIDKIKELFNKGKVKKEERLIVSEEIEIYEEKNYNLNDVIEKAKEENTDETTSYDMTKNLEITDKNFDVGALIESLTETDDKDLLDDLKTETIPDIDKDDSFYTAKMNFNNKDFEEVEENSNMTEILLGVLIFVVILIIAIIVYLVMTLT